MNDTENLTREPHQTLGFFAKHLQAFGSGYCTSINGYLMIETIGNKNTEQTLAYLASFGFTTSGWLSPNLEHQEKSVKISTCAGLFTGVITALFLAKTNNTQTCLEDSSQSCTSSFESSL